MARTNGRDRGVTFKDGAWWTRLYLHGRERWYRCDNKTQAKAVYGRLKADQREGKLFDKQKPVSFKALAEDYHAIVEARRRRPGDDRARLARWRTAFGDRMPTRSPRDRLNGSWRICRGRADNRRRCSAI
jgi:hypothetical protein